MSEEPSFLEAKEVLALYEDISIATGMNAGPINQRMLESAVYRPRQIYSYSEATSIPELGACIAYSITKFHPFFDGNKRTSFAAMDLFLVQNNWENFADQFAIAHMIEKMAANNIDERAFTQWVTSHCRIIEEDLWE